MTSASKNAKLNVVELERLASNIAAGIWNDLVEKPPFKALQLRDYTIIFDAVFQVLASVSKQERKSLKEAI